MKLFGGRALPTPTGEYRPHQPRPDPIAGFKGWAFRIEERKKERKGDKMERQNGEGWERKDGGEEREKEGKFPQASRSVPGAPRWQKTSQDSVKCNYIQYKHYTKFIDDNAHSLRYCREFIFSRETKVNSRL